MQKYEKLEAIRGLAAVYVAISHWILQKADTTYIKPFFKFGQEAVIAFFLLSGFVIFLSYKQQPEITFKRYFIKRFRRIYFPVVIAYIVSIFCTLVDSEIPFSFSWTELVGNLLMLQDFSEAKPGVWFNSFMNNGPLWSLSYEWWFYMLFFPLYKLLNQNKYPIFIVLVISILAWISFLIFPNHASLVIAYLIIWWAGLEAARLFLDTGTFTYKNTWHINAALFIIMLFSLIPFFYEGVNLNKPGIFPFLTFRHFLAAFILFNTGLIWWKYKMIGFSVVIGRFAVFAPISYAIYVIHQPIIRLNVFENESIVANSAEIIFKAAIILLLAYLVEIKWQPYINRLIK